MFGPDDHKKGGPGGPPQTADKVLAFGGDF